ncbi:MAG: hypothetical protein AAFQ65_02065, partial [Myxococcota bacterium]
MNVRLLLFGMLPIAGLLATGLFSAIAVATTPPFVPGEDDRLYLRVDCPFGAGPVSCFAESLPYRSYSTRAILMQVAPKYDATQVIESGLPTSVVRVCAGPSGRVTAAEVVEGPDDALNSASEVAASTWLYEPSDRETCETVHFVFPMKTRRCSLAPTHPKYRRVFGRPLEGERPPV